MGLRVLSRGGSVGVDVCDDCGYERIEFRVASHGGGVDSRTESFSHVSVHGLSAVGGGCDDDGTENRDVVKVSVSGVGDVKFEDIVDDACRTTSKVAVVAGGGCVVDINADHIA